VSGKHLRLRLVEGDLAQLAVDAIVNPANSHGVMGGGVAGAIRKKGGSGIEKEAMKNAPIAIGKAVATTAGSLPCRFVIHAPTMEQPAEVTSIERARKATRAALECADRAHLKQIAFPGMGTGVGRVDPQVAAKVMVEEARRFKPQSLEEVIFVAWDKNLHRAFEKALQTDFLHA